MKALQLDDLLPEAHTSLGGVLALYDWDWAGAAREFHHALELDPQYAPAHHWYAVLYLAPLGHIDEAIAEMQRALEIDPASLIFNTDLGWTDYIGRRSDLAIAQYWKVLAMDPPLGPLTFGFLRFICTRGYT